MLTAQNENRVFTEKSIHLQTNDDFVDRFQGHNLLISAN